MTYTLTREDWAERFDSLGLRWPGEVLFDDNEIYVKLWLDTSNVEVWRYIENTDSYEMLWPKQ